MSAGTLHRRIPTRTLARLLAPLVLISFAACAGSSEPTSEPASSIGSTEASGSNEASATTSDPSATTDSTTVETSDHTTSVAVPTTGQATTTSSVGASSTTVAVDNQAERAFPASEASGYQEVLDSGLASQPSPDASILATVRRADGRSWSGVAGGTDSADQPVRVASVGKTFTATTILQLVEDGRLALDDPASRYLTAATAELLTNDGYDLDRISIRQLLQHTDGIFDYAFGDGSPLLDRALNDQTHRWTRREQLELAVFIGDPLSAPGEAFHYGDTGYVLLGEIIEQVTGQPFPTAMRDLIDYERLSLSSTWMEFGEVAPPGSLPIARSFFGESELTDLDFSIDAFGGGGLAATTADIARFFEALLDGRVFEQPATLASMTEIPSTNLAASDFGVLLGDGASGLYRLELGDLGTCWSHRGFLGTIAITCPEVGATVALTTNIALTEPLPLATQLLEAAVAAG